MFLIRVENITITLQYGTAALQGNRQGHNAYKKIGLPTGKAESLYNKRSVCIILARSRCTA